MSDFTHSHIFLGDGHEHAERRSWAVIWLCLGMMVLEIGGGALFGSIALVADGMHMSTHAGALVLAALAYRFARTHAQDARFTFGTGKFGDLAGFSSGIVLAMIALLIGYESLGRLIAPVPIAFNEAIPIAALGLAVNVASAWLLAGGEHHHHGHGHAHGHAHGHDETKPIVTPGGTLLLSIEEAGRPPVFRLTGVAGPATVETVRPDGARQIFALTGSGTTLESVDPVPEPHEFMAYVTAGRDTHTVEFVEPAQAKQGIHRDNNMRAAVVHVVADAAVSVLVIIGLLLARSFGWLWMDPVAGLVGAAVILSWSYGLLRDTGSILLDVNPDRALTDQMRRAVEASGDRLTDLHVWRLGPGHLGAIVCVRAAEARSPQYYRDRLAGFPTLSHITVEVAPPS